jgi:hypothetical protein
MIRLILVRQWGLTRVSRVIDLLNLYVGREPSIDILVRSEQYTKLKKAGKEAGFFYALFCGFMYVFQWVSYYCYRRCIRGRLF